MNGPTHKAIGTVTGISMTIYGVMTNQPLYALGLLTAPVGALLPDIDHNSTKLGRNRKKVLNIMRIVSIVMLVLSFLIGTLSYSINGQFSALLSSLAVCVPVCLAVLIATSDTLKKAFPFLCEHRGIMHTLVVPVLMWLGASYIEMFIFKVLVLGLALGYISHLVADSLTVVGTPLAFPVTTEPISFAGIRTGTTMETVGAVLLSIAILGLGVGIGKDNSIGKYILYLLAILYAYQLGKKVRSLFKKISKSMLKAFGITFIVITAIQCIIHLITGGSGPTMTALIINISVIVGYFVGNRR